MRVVITVKCLPIATDAEPFAEQYKEFREMMERVAKQGGFGQAVELRFLIDSGKGQTIATA